MDLRTLLLNFNLIMIQIIDEVLVINKNHPN